MRVASFSFMLFPIKKFVFNSCFSHIFFYGITEKLLNIVNIHYLGLWTGLSSDMSYVERVKNIIMTQYFLKIVEPRQNDMFRKYYGSNFPSFTDLAASSALMMVNGEEMFEFARPISHKIIYIGGIGIYSPKSLDNVRFIITSTD